MPSFGGVVFDVMAEEKEGTLSKPILIPEDWGVVKTRIPYGGVSGMGGEQIQFTGTGNARFTLKIECTLVQFTSLVAMLDGVARTLANPFYDLVDYTSMVLVDIKNAWSVTFDDEVHADLTFEVSSVAAF